MNKRLLKDAQSTIESLANSLGMNLEELDENYNDIYKRLDVQINETLYVIKLDNGKYVSIEQISNNEVEVYGVEYEHADRFNIEDSNRLIKGINNGKDDVGFKYYSNQKVVGIE